MTAARLQPPPTTTAPSTEHGHDTLSGSPMGPRLFKKHKVLPHPRRLRSDEVSTNGNWSMPQKYDLVIDTAISKKYGSQTESPTLKHRSRRIGSGPDLPPTPPAHSRNSSSGHSVLASPTSVEGPAKTVETTPIRAPVTPPNQKSPPTPDVTPPQPLSRPRALRPLMSDRASSKATGTESRTESFKTAREDPFSSEEEDSKSTVKPLAPSARTSQVTVRRVSQEKLENSENPKPIGLGLGLESTPDVSLGPKPKEDFVAFDGDWASSNEVEHEWDDNLQRTVVVRKRREAPETPRQSRRKQEVIEDDLVTPTNATMALRSMPLLDRTVVYPTPKVASDREPVWPHPSASELSGSADTRRFSGMSAKSTASTVVEAILVGTTPTRRMTLRHVRKQRVLRDSNSDLSPGSSAPSSSLVLEETLRQPRVNGRLTNDRRHESYASNTTFNSVSSGKARREVWKNGGIPVVIVPDRRSSVKSKSSREPSLRSTSSHRSKRSVSLNSARAPHGTLSTDLTPLFDRPPRRKRTMSESDGSDQRTIDFPPVIPKRSSSLSAPTSRNNSRTGSLTAESLRAQNALQAYQDEPRKHQEVARTQPPKTPGLTLQRALSFESEKDDHLHRPHLHRDHGLQVDGHGDPFFGKRLSAQNTPFSQVSVETNGTAPEVSEALAINIYPHQNTSVLMVDHSSKPSEDSDGSQRGRETDKPPERPKITTTGPDGEGPVTPPQPGFSMDDVDSPLRNPRAPPEPPTDPPAIKFIPATPSGLTPAHEKKNLMGNYFEETGPEKPKRSMSLVRRALSRRRNSESYPPKAARPGFLTRTLSLSRNVNAESSFMASGKRTSLTDPPYPTLEQPPAEGNKLHPFWRPAYSDHEDEDWVRDVESGDEIVYRYPPVDNRPPLPRRSLSSRMKRTFAILPVNDDVDYYLATSHDGPERRTIRRTGSGNLRVVKHRRSLDSVRRGQQAHDTRPYTAPEESGRSQHFWGSRTRSGAAAKPLEGKKRRFSVSGTIEGLQNLPRRLSERRREKRTQELRQKISGPREVRDGVGEVVRPRSYRDSYQQTQV